MIIALLMAIHLIFCLLLWLALRTGKGRIGAEFALLSLFMPVLGPLLTLMVYIMTVRGNRTERPLDVSRLQLDDEIYRTIDVEDRHDASLVPLEDALVLDDPLQRRSLMLEILKDDSSQYLGALSSAQQNEDGEVVHYATTALAENLRKYEYDLRRYELATNNAPHDPSVLRDFAEHLADYLHSGMIEGQVAAARSEQYTSVLQQLVKLDWNVTDANLLFGALLNRGNMTEAREVFVRMEHSWPHDKAILFARMKLAWHKQDHDEMKRALADASSGAFQLTDTEKADLTFWSRTSLNDEGTRTEEETA